MLSYRHGFHAGNFADVLKHLVQVEILTYLQKKDKAFDYIDTHAGAGLYRLQSTMATKNNEYRNGIGRLLQSTPDVATLQPYLEQIWSHNPDERLRVYPGSPAIARSLLRPQDKAWLYELHPSDVVELRRSCSALNVHIRQEDGFRALTGLLPTQSRRAFVLIDPPYELKQDYLRVLDALKLIYRRMPAATVALWYPVVERARIDQLESQIKTSGVRNVVQFELGIAPDSEGPGMTSAGMIVVNPPWMLLGDMQELLPGLASVLGEDGEDFYECRTLVGE